MTGRKRLERGWAVPEDADMPAVKLETKRDRLSETLRIALPAIAESLFTAIIGFVDSFRRRDR